MLEKKITNWKATWQGAILLSSRFSFTEVGMNSCSVGSGKDSQGADGITWAKTARSNHPCVEQLHLCVCWSCLRRQRARTGSLPTETPPGFAPQAGKAPKKCKEKIWERKKFKRPHKAKNKNKFPVKLQHSTRKWTTWGLAMEGQNIVENVMYKCKRRDRKSSKKPQSQSTYLE